MLYSYENDFGNDLAFWSNATGDLHHDGRIDEGDLQLLVFVPWDASREAFGSLADWLDATVYEL